MTKKPEHRLKLIRTAARLFQTQGYSASGVNQIITESKTPRGSFYYYFPQGKEQLADETIRFTGEEIRRLLEQVFEKADSFSSGLDDIANVIAEWFEASGYRAGCPITTIHLEKTPESMLLAKACQHVFTSWLATVEKMARQFGHEKQAKDLAQAVILGLEGAWILARASKSKSPFYICADMVKFKLP